MSELKNRIREIRLEKKISGTKLAKELGISPQYFYDIEKGERNLSADLAVKISDILGISVGYLLGDELTARDAELIKYNYDERELNSTILEKLKLITNDEGYFFEDIKLQCFMAVANNLYMAPAYHNSGDHFTYSQLTIEFFDNPDEYTENQSAEIIKDLDEAYNYKNIKSVLPHNDIESKYNFLEEINKIIIKNDIVQPIHTTNEQDFINDLELSDDKILERFDIKLDGKALSKEETKGVIAYLRSLRQID